MKFSAAYQIGFDMRQLFERLPVLFQSAMYSLRGGFLIRPLVIAVVLGALGAVLSAVEEAAPQINALIPDILFPSHEDPGVAQVILSSIATSIMTVVSIVFAILLMTLTLASTQFSPRILTSFVRDRTTQWTLGVFLGTLLYGGFACGAWIAAPFCTRRDRHGSDGARAGLCGMVDLLHQPHFPINQRQSHRGSDCA
jgi:uncharacterized membrane protein YciS (DUF1049 family)